MSHVFCEWVMSLVWMSHVLCEWVMSFVDEPCLLKASDSWLCIHICIPKMYSKGFYVYMHEYAGLYVNIHVCTCVCVYMYALVWHLRCGFMAVYTCIYLRDVMMCSMYMCTYISAFVRCMRCRLTTTNICSCMGWQRLASTLAEKEPNTNGALFQGRLNNHGCQRLASPLDS